MTSVNRLQTICKQALESNPDIIFLTGDFFNVEAYSTDEQALYNALLPLKQVANRTFACLGVIIFNLKFLFIICANYF